MKKRKFFTDVVKVDYSKIPSAEETSSMGHYQLMETLFPLSYDMTDLQFPLSPIEIDMVIDHDLHSVMTEILKTIRLPLMEQLLTLPSPALLRYESDTVVLIDSTSVAFTVERWFMDELLFLLFPEVSKKCQLIGDNDHIRYLYNTKFEALISSVKVEAAKLIAVQLFLKFKKSAHYTLCRNIAKSKLPVTFGCNIKTGDGLTIDRDLELSAVLLYFIHGDALKENFVAEYGKTIYSKLLFYGQHLLQSQDIQLPPFCIPHSADSELFVEIYELCIVRKVSYLPLLDALRVGDVSVQDGVLFCGAKQISCDELPIHVACSLLYLIDHSSLETIQATYHTSDAALLIIANAFKTALLTFQDLPSFTFERYMVSGEEMYKLIDGQKVTELLTEKGQKVAKNKEKTLLQKQLRETYARCAKPIVFTVDGAASDLGNYVWVVAFVLNLSKFCNDYYSKYTKSGCERLLKKIVEHINKL